MNDINVQAADPADASTDMLAAVRALGRGTLVERLGIEIVSARRGEVVGTMPVEGNTQPARLLHGGASAALAETLGSYAAKFATAEGMIPVGTDLNCTHHRSARSGLVTGVATPLREGRRVGSYAIEIRDEGGELVCTSRLSVMFVPDPRG